MSLANEIIPLFGAAEPVVPTTKFNEALALAKLALEYTFTVLAKLKADSAILYAALACPLTQISRALFAALYAFCAVLIPKFAALYAACANTFAELALSNEALA